MNPSDLYYNIYYLVLLTATICCFMRYRVVPASLKIFAVLVALSALTEYTAYFTGKYLHTNIEVYSVFSIIQLLLVCIYFNEAIIIFRRFNTGIWLGLLGALAGILNFTYLQPLNEVNSYFLFFEGIITIGLVLFSFARIMIEGSEQSIIRNPHFWIGIVLIFYWSLTFCNMALYNYLFDVHSTYNWIVSYSILAGNMITYTGISVIYLRYPKWQRQNG